MLLYMMRTTPNVIPFLVVLFPEHTLLYELCLYLLLFSFVKKHLTRVNFIHIELTRRKQVIYIRAKNDKTT